MFLFKRKRPYKHPEKEKRVHCIIFDRRWAVCSIDRWMDENEYTYFDAMKRNNEFVYYVTPRYKFSGLLSRTAGNGITLIEGV